MLYSKNTFGADTFDALTYLPPDALSHLRSVVLAIPRNSICVSEWISLLKTLPSSLRTLQVWFGMRPSGNTDKFSGIGTSIDFVRAIGEVKGLSKLTIRGYYAVNWPEYLRRVMDCPVEAIAGCRRKSTLQAIQQFQEGTEHLLP